MGQIGLGFQHLGVVFIIIVVIVALTVGEKTAWLLSKRKIIVTE